MSRPTWVATLPALALLTSGCAVVTSTRAGLLASSEYESAPSSREERESKVLAPERVLLRTFPATFDANGTHVAIEARDVCATAHDGMERRKTLHPARVSSLYTALLVDSVLSTAATYGVAWAGANTPDAVPAMVQRSVLATGLGGAGVSLAGAALWLYPRAASERVDRHIVYATDTCGAWRPHRAPTDAAAVVWSAQREVPDLQTNTVGVVGERPLMLVPSTKDLEARRAALPPQWVKADDLKPLEADPYAVRPDLDGEAFPLQVEAEGGFTIPADVLGQLAWSRTKAEPLDLLVDLHTPDSAPGLRGRGGGLVGIPASAFETNDAAWRCASLARPEAGKPWTTYAASRLAPLLRDLEVTCEGPVREARAAMCATGDAEAAKSNSLAGTDSTDLAAYRQACPGETWARAAEEQFSAALEAENWDRAQFLVQRNLWGDDAWRSTAETRLVPAQVRSLASQANNMEGLFAAESARHLEGGRTIPAAHDGPLVNLIGQRALTVLGATTDVSVLTPQWFSQGTELGAQLGGAWPAALTRVGDAAQTRIVQSADAEVRALVTNQDFEQALAKINAAGEQFAGQAQVARWAAQKGAAVRAQQAAWERAEAARQAARERAQECVDDKCDWDHCLQEIEIDRWRGTVRGPPRCAQWIQCWRGQASLAGFRRSDACVDRAQAACRRNCGSPD